MKNSKYIIVMALTSVAHDRRVPFREHSKNGAIYDPGRGHPRTKKSKKKRRGLP